MQLQSVFPSCTSGVRDAGQGQGAACGGLVPAMGGAAGAAEDVETVAEEQHASRPH